MSVPEHRDRSQHVRQPGEPRQPATPFDAMGKAILVLGKGRTPAPKRRM